ncbi:AP-1 complex subunit sigma, putative [Plasmodium ovale curtisi]|uniref:AP complex subunit sigma n=1 Tax=Plasmodium ovale curtisi TaxID=864141 RepID=A0A1A8VXF7_PLAOA|nr:AP-1 complex subunit sigma, putative [Plasmodium ovale curtisi]
MIHFVLLISRQGKTRLAKWYIPLSQKEKAKIIRETSQITLNRTPKLCNFVEWREYKLVFKRYPHVCTCLMDTPIESTYVKAFTCVLVITYKWTLELLLHMFVHIFILFHRYASLFFIACIDKSDNELITLEIIHHYVEILDKYFGNVCELDLIFNFHKAYYLLDEILVTGELQESSKKNILRVVSAQDSLMEDSKSSKKLGAIL